MKNLTLQRKINAPIFLLLLCSFGICAQPSNQSISLFSQSIVDDLSHHYDEFILNEIIGSDVYKNDYLPIDLQIRPQSLVFEDLSSVDRKRIKLMISQVLSSKGYMKLLTNLSIADELNEKSNKTTNHVIKFYGKPSTGSWGFKLEGYHLSLTFLIENHEFKFINYFIGQDLELLNRTEYLSSALYNQEAQIGSDLMNGLSARQLGKTYLSMNTPSDIMTNPNTSFRVTEKWGLPSKSLRKKQMPVFGYWVMQYLDLFDIRLMEPLIDVVDENEFEDLYLVWSGQFDITNKNFYYLIYNDQIIIEHNVRNNHIHSITRITF